MSCFDLIDQMIHANARVGLKQNYARFKVTLTEPACADSEVTVDHVPQRSIVIKLDGRLSLLDIFKGNLGECKRADYIIVSDTGNGIVFVHLEIKREKGGTTRDACNQLRGSECFAKYLQYLGKAFGGEHEFLDGVSHRFVRVCGTRPRKRKTRVTKPDGAVFHDSPDSAMKIYGTQYVPYKKLTDGN